LHPSYLWTVKTYMKVIAIKDFGKLDNFYLDELPIPKPDYGEVCVKIYAVSFNASDYKTRLGMVGGKLPMILGKDFSGIIASIGDGVDRFVVGDEVYGYLGGKCSNGSYAEYVCAPQTFLAKKPANLTFSQASAIPLAGLTAYECVIKKAKIKKDQAVFIAGGSGGVGSIAIELCHHIGSTPIIVTSGGNESTKYLIEECRIKPHWVVPYRGCTVQQLAEQVIKINNGNKLEAVFDFVGKNMKKLCFEILDFDSSLTTIVPESDDFSIKLWDRRLSPTYSKSSSVHFVFLGARALFGTPETWTVYQEELTTLAILYERGLLKPPKITNIGNFSVKAVQDAHSMIENNQVKGKIVMSIL
jgi:NADPH:quinone reductase